MKSLHKYLYLILLGLLVAGAAEARKYPDETDDGLVRVKHRGLDAVYWREGATLDSYDKVMIGDVDVSFRKNWQRDQNSSRRGTSNRITAEDMTKIRDAVAEGFRETFTKELESGGYQLVDTAGDDVLALEPSIVDLDVSAPDLSMRQAGMTRTYTTSAGRMTLNMDLLDSGSNSLVGRVIDERRDMDTGQLQWSNRITNQQAALVMYRAWARQLVKALDESRQR